MTKVICCLWDPSWLVLLNSNVLNRVGRNIVGYAKKNKIPKFRRTLRKRCAAWERALGQPVPIRSKYIYIPLCSVNLEFVTLSVPSWKCYLHIYIYVHSRVVHDDAKAARRRHRVFFIRSLSMNHGVLRFFRVFLSAEIATENARSYSSWLTIHRPHRNITCTYIHIPLYKFAGARLSEYMKM